MATPHDYHQALTQQQQAAIMNAQIQQAAGAFGGMSAGLGSAYATARNDLQRTLAQVSPYTTPTKPVVHTIPYPENPIMAATSKPSGLKSILIVLAASWLAWKIWTERDQIFAKIEEATAELQTKLGLAKSPVA